MKHITLLLFTIFFEVFTSPAKADTLLFNNFPFNGSIASTTLVQISGTDGGGPNAASDSFTIAADGVADQVLFAAWVSPGDSVTSVDWMIGTSLPFTNDIGSGIADPLSFVILGNTEGYDVDAVVFSLPNLPLSTGTYYLTLYDAVANGNPVYWDLNERIGVDAWNTKYGECPTTSCASSFEIMNSTPSNPSLPDGPAPELPTRVLFGVGIISGAALRRTLIRH